MILPKKWGQGQLFAFSALDGDSFASDDFTGMLCGDRIGVRFFSKVKRELAIVNVYGRNLAYDLLSLCKASHRGAREIYRQASCLF